jgi:hypothetical protein
VFKRNEQVKTEDLPDPPLLTADEMRVLAKFKDLNQAGNWPDLAAMEAEACATACELRVTEPEDAASINSHLGECYSMPATSRSATYT